MEMSESDKKFIAKLEAMPLEQARRELASGTFGRVGSPNHSFALSWLAVKEAEFRDSREASFQRSMRRAVRIDRIIAMIAIIIAAIAARDEIMWLISLLLNKIMGR
jgi:hypothetical protein